MRAVQLLLGHTKLESTVRYLGIKVDDAVDMAGRSLTMQCIATVEPGRRQLANRRQS